MTTILYDMKLRRPGCVLLQRCFGATVSDFDLQQMDPMQWLTALTPDLKVYEIDGVNLEALKRYHSQQKEKRAKLLAREFDAQQKEKR